MPKLFDLADFPPVKPLFASQQEAHDAMMEDVQWVLQQSKEFDCFPDQKLFLQSVQSLWLDVWCKYAPRP